MRMSSFSLYFTILADDSYKARNPGQAPTAVKIPWNTTTVQSSLLAALAIASRLNPTQTHAGSIEATLGPGFRFRREGLASARQTSAKQHQAPIAAASRAQVVFGAAFRVASNPP